RHPAHLHLHSFPTRRSSDLGRPTCNLVPAPEMFASDNTECLTQDVEGAKALLEEAGWTDSDGDGIRDKDGKKLSLLYQTSVNARSEEHTSELQSRENLVCRL